MKRVIIRLDIDYDEFTYEDPQKWDWEMVLKDLGDVYVLPQSEISDTIRIICE
jgi:hypothetical protein